MSFTTRFLYNTDAPSVASLMASGGVKSESGFSLATKTEATPENPQGPENKEQPQPAPAAKPVEPTTLPQNAEKGTPESPQQPQEPEKPVTQKEVAPKVPTLQEVLKSQQPETIFKELGFDDRVVKLVNTAKENQQMLAFFEHWMANGDTSEYLRQLNTDYSKMSAEEVLRQQLRQEYPKASEEALNALFKAEVLERYKLDPDMYTPEEIKESRLLMEARADKYRDVLVANQQKFLLPKPPEPKPVEQNDEQQVTQALEAYKSQVLEHKTAKDILANKFITIGEGEEKVNIPLSDPASTLDLIYNSEKWAGAMQDENGKPDIGKQILVAAFAENPGHFLKEYAKYFLALGGKKAIDPIENAKLPENGTPAKSETTPSSPAAAMAKHGRQA